MRNRNDIVMVAGGIFLAAVGVAPWTIMGADTRYVAMFLAIGCAMAIVLLAPILLRGGELFLLSLAIGFGGSTLLYLLLMLLGRGALQYNWDVWRKVGPDELLLTMAGVSVIFAAGWLFWRWRRPRPSSYLH